MDEYGQQYSVIRAPKRRYATPTPSYLIAEGPQNSASYRYNPTNDASNELFEKSRTIKVEPLPLIRDHVSVRNEDTILNVVDDTNFTGSRPVAQLFVQQEQIIGQ